MTTLYEGTFVLNDEGDVVATLAQEMHYHGDMLRWTFMPLESLPYSKNREVDHNETVPYGELQLIFQFGKFGACRYRIVGDSKGHEFRNRLFRTEHDNSAKLRALNLLKPDLLDAKFLDAHQYRILVHLYKEPRNGRREI